MQQDKKHTSEFRKDIVSGEWILVAPSRGKRPILQKTSKECPFEDPQKSGNAAPILWRPKLGHASVDMKDWFVQVVPNKYPVLSLDLHKVCPVVEKNGIYRRMDGVGSHEIIITRDHDLPIDKMSVKEIELVVEVFQERYKMIEKDECVEYIFIFHNQGPLAGASVPHPHSQLVALPIIPPDVSDSIKGALRSFGEHNKCVYCVMLETELSDKTRIIYQNEHFVAVTPYASRVPYEIRIYPIKHSSDFEEMTDEQRPFFALALKETLSRMNKVLKNPDYNFFIHTITARIKNAPYYHWHVEILPHLYKWAGIELGTGVEIITDAPEDVADKLRSAK